MFVLGVAAILALAWPAQAALIIDLPDLVLQPNQAGQAFTFSVQNDGASVGLNGIQLELIVADGGPQVPGGTITGPAIRMVSVIYSGTLFAGNNTGDRGAGNVFGGNTYDQVFQRLTSTSAGTVSLDSGTFLLASIEFDTTGGIPAGQYTWSVSSSPNGVSYFTDGNGQIFPTLIPGVLTVVPESEYCGMAAALIALGAALAQCCRNPARVSSAPRTTLATLPKCGRSGRENESDE